MSDASGKPNPTPRPVEEMLAERDALRASTGASGSTLEAMMAALSAQVTRDAQDRKAGDAAPKEG